MHYSNNVDTIVPCFFCCSAFNAEQQSGAEMQKIKYDKVRQLDKIVFLALGLILVALVIQMAILKLDQ